MCLGGRKSQKNGIYLVAIPVTIKNCVEIIRL